MSLRSNDQFDNFRRERQRMRAKLGPVAGLGYENKALRELEQVEAREQLEQRLTKEVHEFFATATRQAADIVERVAHDAQEQAGQRVEQEMESFLIDALARMNSFVVSMLQQRRPPVASTEMEPRVKRIVGDSLDEFRWEGTADVGDKHIGQDPFDTDVDEVRREFRAQVGEAAPADQQLPIEEHKVAAAHGDDEPEQASADESEAEPAAESEPVTAPATAVAEPAEPEAAAAAEPRGPSPAEELERFKSALKSLVRQGTMSRDEAKAAWQARLQKLGLA